VTIADPLTGIGIHRLVPVPVLASAWPGKLVKSNLNPTT